MFFLLINNLYQRGLYVRLFSKKEGGKKTVWKVFKNLLKIYMGGGGINKGIILKIYNKPSQLN